MEFRRIWVLRGPNAWSRVSVLEIEADLGALRDHTTADLPGFTDRLTSLLPALNAPRTAGAAALLESLRRVADPAEAVRLAALELQALGGCEAGFGFGCVKQAADGSRSIVVEFEEEEIGRAAAEAARRFVLAAAGREEIDASAEIAKLRELAHDVRLGPSTRSIVRAARERGIPVRRLNRDSLVQLGWGVKARRILTAETDRTGAIAEAIAQDKELTRSLLRAAGVPVPTGRPVSDADDAWKAAESIGVPVVVKPRYGNHGRGVATNLSTREQVAAAYAAARAEDSHVMVEKFAPGDDHRLLVINGVLVAAALREPANVIGDGRSTIRQLVAEANRDPRRSDGHATSLSFIKLNDIALAVLSEQGYSPDSVPPAGVRVLIRRNGNLSTGGTATDVTDRVHPTVAARAVDAAAAVGLDIAGVDVVATDIGKPLEDQAGAVVEVNAGPGLRMHLEPSAGTPRPVGRAVVDGLFAAADDGRIPIAAVTGVNGKTTTTRLLAHILRQAGHCVGMTCSEGVWIGGRRIEVGDCSGPQSASTVLLNPAADAAVLETARGGILRAGLGFDRCDVAVATNVGRGDHLGMRGVETAGDLAVVKRVVVESVSPAGAGVLNAEDEAVAAMAPACPGRVVWFALDADHPRLSAHRTSGGRAVAVRGDSVVLIDGPREEALAAVSEIPMTHGGRVAFQVRNALAAAAAAWCLGVPAETIRAALASFDGGPDALPARFNLVRGGDRPVVVDFAHNASAVEALAAALDGFPQRRRTVVTCPFNRRDDEIHDIGRALGAAFDRIVLYRAKRPSPERAEGELAARLRAGISAGGRAREVLDAADEAGAVASTLADQKPGELLVIGPETPEGFVFPEAAGDFAAAVQ